MSNNLRGKPKTIALALGSGGARGYAHIGVIEEIQARGWEIVGVSGTSMGAVVGGLYVGGAMESYRDWAVGLGRRDVMRLMDPGLGGAGVLRASRVMSKVKEHLGDMAIEDARMPYTAVAVDLVAQREVWFTSGPMIDAMRASIAIPTVFTPLAKDGMVLADGGLLNPVPVAPLASVHADALIAVNLSGPSVTTAHGREEVFTGIKFPKIKFPSFPQVIEPALRALVPAFGRGEDGKPDEHHELRMNTLDVVDRSLNLMQEAIRRYRLAGYPPDVLVNVPLDSCGTLDFHRAKDLIEVGRDRAVRAFDAWEAGEPLVL
ncbi:patatin-like phospholipase family protein [Demequina lutea]|uniref:NTE family protein n=1 Tax=Demequina lutea TaxID=431489 RepID=A0A7Z0CJI3_9MICO|nr:patatin-like phospholipase family protein [Demequina lutea]NYI40933.1 NTE family protein [Demequina lutea]